MKKLTSVLLCLFLAGNLFAIVTKATSSAPVKKTSQTDKKATTSVTFDGKKFFLQYSVGNEQQWLNEFLPAGVTFDNYDYMFTIRSYDGIKATPKQIGSNMLAAYQQRFPANKYQFFPGVGEDAGVSFIEMNDKVLEFNLFRITTVDGHPLALQFVYREYMGTDYKAAMDKLSKTVRANLDKWKTEILTMPVPAINRTVKN